MFHSDLLAPPLLLVNLLKDGDLAGQAQQQCSGDLSGQLIGNVVHHRVAVAVQGGDLNERDQTVRFARTLLE